MSLRIATIVLLITMMSAAVAADIGVSPPRIDVTVPRGGEVTTTFNVIWSGSEPTQLQIAKSDWTLDASGAFQTLPIGESAHSASDWVTPAADSIALPAAGQAEMRVTIRVPDSQSLVGTYQTVVFAETPATPSTGSGTHVTMRQRVGVVMYVTVAGTETKGSKLVDLYLDGGAVDAVVSNLGNTTMRYSGSLQVRDSNGQEVQTVPISEGVVLRDSERDVRIPLPELPSGFYVLLGLVKDGRGGLLTGQIPYEVK